MVEHDRHEEAEQSLRKLYSDEEEELIIRTQIEIREQIQLEAAQRQHKNLGHALIELFTWKNIDSLDAPDIKREMIAVHRRAPLNYCGQP